MVFLSECSMWYCSLVILGSFLQNTMSARTMTPPREFSTGQMRILGRAMSRVIFKGALIQYASAGFGTEFSAGDRKICRDYYSHLTHRQLCLRHNFQSNLLDILCYSLIPYSTTCHLETLCKRYGAVSKLIFLLTDVTTANRSWR